MGAARKYQHVLLPSIGMLPPPRSFSRKDFYWAEFDYDDNRILLSCYLFEPEVPAWVVSVVWEHEFLHWKHGCRHDGEWHCTKFRKEERENPALAAADEWLAAYLVRLKELHSKKKSRRRVR